MRGLMGLMIGVALLTASCRTYSSRQVQDPRPAIERIHNGGSLQQEVDLLAQPLIDKGDVFGLAVGVASPSGAAFFGYGGTGLNDGPGAPRADTIFEVGSISKVFVSAVLAQLVAEKQLRYEDRVRDILPAGTKLGKDVGDLTLYELVTHTGGLPRQPATFSQLTYFVRYLFTGKNLYGYIDKPFLYHYLARCHPKPKEARTYEYSNIGVGLLTHLVEVKTGRSMAQLVEERITRPLGMRDTVYALNPEQLSRLAVGHAGGQPRFMRRHTPMPPWQMGEILHPTAGLYSTVNDLLIFAKANLGLVHNSLGELLLSTQQVQLYRPEEDVAFGWLLNHFDGCTIVYKHGMVAGYNAYVGMDHEQQVAVVVLCNTFGWNDKIGHNLILRLAGAQRAGHGRLLSSTSKAREEKTPNTVAGKP